MTNKVPNIRFKGFTDDWEQRKVGDFLIESREKGNGGDKAKKITVKLWGKGVFEKENLGSSNTQYYVRHAGQFIYSKLDFLNCAFGVVPNKLDGLETTADVPAFNCLGINPYFMYYTAIQPSFYINNGMKADGSRKAKRIHSNTFLNMPISCPSEKEQDMICNSLLDLDHLITLHQRKCEQTKELKKFMLQKMFPKKGEKNPEIRFSGFTDDWEQRKVDDVTTSYSGGTPQAGNSEYYNGTIPFIRSGEIYESHTELFITEKGLENSSAKMVSKGDILYALYGATSGEVSRSNIDGAINQAILAITPNDGYNANFLVEWFRKEKESIIDKYLQGGQGNLSAQIIKKLEIPFPTFEEQNEIGRYFTEINHLITLHQRKCEQLKELKKFMLQNMFPKKG